MRILLLGSNERAGYSIARSLSKSLHTVDVYNDKYHALKFSKYVNSFFVSRCSFEKNTDQAVLDLADHLRTTVYDVLIPVHDTALTICYQFNKVIAEYTKIAYINKEEVHRYCRDKSELLAICNRLDLPTPHSTCIKNLDELELLKNIQYPCIAKPVSSKVYRDGKIFSYTVKKIYKEEELIDCLREKIETVPVMIQEILPDGFGVGYNFLAEEGKVVQAYAHQRINEAWGGGQSTYRKTIDVTSFKLETVSKKIIENIDWTGIAMIEFLVINDIPYIMEINGRAWGSIELGIFAGCNLPDSMIKALIERKKVIAFTDTNTYYARNLLNEIIWILQSKSPKKVLNWLISLKVCFRKNEIVEDSVFRDFRFRMAYIFSMLSHLVSRSLEKMRKHLLVLPLKTISNYTLLNNKRIALICKGNINRSAFAEFYFKEKYPNYSIRSFGTVFEENRLSPVNAVKAANKRGFNMNIHRSKYLTDLAISETDVFIVMDKENYRDLRKRNIPSSKIYQLGKTVVPDPYGKEEQYFDIVFDAIAKNIDTIFHKKNTV